MLVRILQRKEPIHEEIFYRELAHRIMEAKLSPGELMVQVLMVQFKANLEGRRRLIAQAPRQEGREGLLSQSAFLFYSGLKWGRPTHIGESNLLYSICQIRS